MKKNFLGWINQIRNRKNSSNLQFRVRERKEKKKREKLKFPRTQRAWIRLKCGYARLRSAFKVRARSQTHSRTGRASPLEREKPSPLINARDNEAADVELNETLHRSSACSLSASSGLRSPPTGGQPSRTLSSPCFFFPLPLFPLPP